MKQALRFATGVVAFAAFMNTASAEQATPLDGVWAEGICKSSKVEPYRKQEFWSFESPIVQAINSMVYFNGEDRACEQAPAFFINTYFEYQAEGLKEQGFAKLDLEIEKITFESSDQKLIDALKENETCGLRNWKINREIEISARHCFMQKFREIGDKLYAEYTLDEELNLVMTKKLKSQAKNRGKGKKQNFFKIEDR